VDSLGIGLCFRSQASSVVFAPGVSVAPNQSVSSLYATYRPGRITCCRHLASTVDVCEPTLRTVFGQES
jgi:hypothetical protein